MIHNLFIAIPIQSQPTSSLASTLPLALLLHPLLLPSTLFAVIGFSCPACLVLLSVFRPPHFSLSSVLSYRYLYLSLKPLGFFFTLFILIVAHFLSCPFCISSVRSHFPPLLPESFSFTFYNFLPLPIFSDPILLINIYHYNPFLTFPISLCFSFTSFCLSSITLFTPCVVGTLADSSLFPGTAIWIRHLLASVCCLRTG